MTFDTSDHVFRTRPLLVKAQLPEDVSIPAQASSTDFAASLPTSPGLSSTALGHVASSASHRRGKTEALRRAEQALIAQGQKIVNYASEPEVAAAAARRTHPGALVEVGDNFITISRP